MTEKLETKKSNEADDQQLRASDPEASVWVSANAGSGKTHALTTRVTRLLLAGTEPERILCLTYTKAAAAEMSSRLYARLGDWAMLDDEKLMLEIAGIEGPLPDKTKLTRARRLFARAIETPGGLKIQTIHAFCQSLLGRFPLEAQVPPNFRVLDDRSAADILTEVRDDVLARARSQPGSLLGDALDFIVTRADESSFSKLMGEITSKRSAFKHLMDACGDADGIVEALYKVMGLDPDTTGEDLKSAFFQPDHFPEAAMRHAMKVLLDGIKTDVKTGEKLAAVLGMPQDRRVEAHDTYIAAFLTQKGEPRDKLITKKPAEEHPDVFEALSKEQVRVLVHANRLRSLHVARASAAIIRLAVEILKGFAETKRRRAYLDYEDMIAQTRALLITGTMAPWVLFKLDGGIDHILVDEAQDTSPDQWDVISALTEEFLSGAGARDLTRTIFAVGDEKQSIYSFQGADPRRFDEMQRHFASRVAQADMKWDPVRLVRSFRSTPEVLRAVDLVFANDAARQGLTASGEVDAHDAVRRQDAGRVELWDLERPDEDDSGDAWDAPLDYVSEADPRAKLAQRIARTIRDWLDSGEILPAKGRPIVPGDILILVRRRNAFVSEMVRRLKKLDIAVAGADRMVLTDEIAVMDLMALGEFTLLPEDDLNLAILLKSPLLGLDEDDLFELAHGRGGRTLWHVLSARANEKAHWQAAYALLERLLARADFEPPYEFFAHVLGEEEGRRKILARLGADANEPVDEFLNLALEFEREHVASMQGFLHWLMLGGAEIKRDMDKGRNEVRIMTVHGSKGLEAEIVFMPDTCSPPAGQLAPSLITLDKSDPALLLWPVRKDDEDLMSAQAREQWKQAQEEEYRRLLYVAMTRARDRLYVCGYLGKRKLEEKCWYNLVSEALRPAAEAIEQPDGRTIWRIEGKQTSPVKQMPAIQPVAEKPIAAWLNQSAGAEPSPSRPLAPSRLPPDGQEEPAALSPLAGDRKARFQRGTLIHRLLQSLPDLPAAQRHAAARRLLAGPHLGLGEEAREEIAAAAMAVLEDTRFADLFGPTSRAEAALVGRIEFAGKPVLVSGQIDRLCVTENRVLVIDYKTNRPAPVSLDEVNPAYFAQMAAYRAVLCAIYPEHDVVCALLWTDGPRLMELPAAQLDAALQTRAQS